MTALRQIGWPEEGETTMSEEKPYEITISVRGAQAGDEAVKHLEGPLWHGTANDVAADLEGRLRTRSGNKIRTINGTDR